MKLSLFAKALIIPILITSFLLFNGCSSNYSSKWTDDDLPTLYGIVVDANTNSPMDSVMVSWMDNRDSLGVATVYTDENGYYSIKGLNYGAYTFTVYKDSTYATVISTKTILTVSVGDGSATEAGLVDAMPSLLAPQLLSVWLMLFCNRQLLSSSRLILSRYRLLPQPLILTNLIMIFWLA